MGEEVSAQSYTREQRQRYREKVRQNLDVFERMLSQSHFEFDRPMTGLELSLIHISEPTRHLRISYAVFCLKKIFFNDTATTEIYTLEFVGSVRCV